MSAASEVNGKLTGTERGFSVYEADGFFADGVGGGQPRVLLRPMTGPLNEQSQSAYNAGTPVEWRGRNYQQLAST